jgi:co-chaperonin GroES (HSP10)
MLPKSRFLEFFKAAYPNDKSRLIGDLLIVERIKFPEKKVGSLYISNSKHLQSTGLTSEVPEFYRVLAVGQGYYDDETGEDAPLEVRPGAIVHASSVSVRVWSSFPFLEITESDILGKLRYSDVQWQWETEEDFIKELTELNTAAKTQVSSSD